MDIKENGLLPPKFASAADSSKHQIGRMFQDETLKTPAIVIVHPDYLIVESETTYLAIQLAFQPRFSLIYSQNQQQQEAEPIGIYFEPKHQMAQIRLFSDEPSSLHQLFKILIAKPPRPNFHKLYKAIRKIGKGTSATVYLGQRLSDGTEVAVKAFPKQTLMADPRGREALQNEINVMRQLRHRHLLQLLEVFETENTIYLCTEYLKGGQLYTRTMNQRLEPVQIHQYLRQLLEALVAMKRKGIIHRDIKPENIVFRQAGGDELVLADFGLATAESAKSYIYVRCGTPGFAAPEILLSKQGGSQKCISDMFSVGIVVYFMIFRKLPYRGTNVADISRQNRKCDFEFSDNITDKMDPFLVDLMLRMIEADPEKRITPEGALQHLYFTRNLSEQATTKPLEENISECYRELNRMQRQEIFKLTDTLGTFMMGRTVFTREHSFENEPNSFQLITFSPTSPNTPKTPNTEVGTPFGYGAAQFSQCLAARSHYFSEGAPRKKVHLDIQAIKKAKGEQLHES